MLQGFTYDWSVSIDEEQDSKQTCECLQRSVQACQVGLQQTSKGVRYWRDTAHAPDSPTYHRLQCLQMMQTWNCLHCWVKLLEKKRIVSRAVRGYLGCLFAPAFVDLLALTCSAALVILIFASFFYADSRFNAHDRQINNILASSS